MLTKISPSRQGDIEVMTPNRCDVTGRSALDEFRANSRIRNGESAKKSSEEAGCEGREYSDANNARLATCGRRRVNGSQANLAQRSTRAEKECLAGVSEMDTTMVANKQRHTNLNFQVSNAPAYGGFMKLRRLCRTPEAAALGRNSIPKMSQLDRQKSDSLSKKPPVSEAAFSASNVELHSARLFGPAARRRKPRTRRWSLRMPRRDRSIEAPNRRR
jgi:hypothetical protein